MGPFEISGIVIAHILLAMMVLGPYYFLSRKKKSSGPSDASPEP